METRVQKVTGLTEILQVIGEDLKVWKRQMEENKIGYFKTLNLLLKGKESEISDG